MVGATAARSPGAAAAFGHALLAGTLALMLALSLSGCTRQTAAAPVEVNPYAGLSAEDQVTKLQEALNTNPNDALAHFRLGNAYYDLQQLSRAEEEYREALRIDPRMVKAQGNLGSVMEEQDRLPEAVTAYRKTVELAPRDAAAHCNLGSALYATGEIGKAVDEYREALRLNPDDAQAHYNLAVAFADARPYREALRHWQRVLELDPTSPAGKNAQTNLNLLKSLRDSESRKKAAADKSAEPAPPTPSNEGDRPPKPN